jgi:hypothetical protein
MATIKIPNMRVRQRATGLFYSWECPPALRGQGWDVINFGTDLAAAETGCRARNAEIAAWRKGEAIIPMIRPMVKRETLAHFAAKYEREHLSHKSPNHIRNARSHLKMICALFGDLKPEDVKPHHVADWIDRMRGRGKYSDKPRQVSDVTAHNRLRTYNALQNWIRNPHEKFGQPKGRKQSWEADDEAAFIAAAYDLDLPSMALAMQLAIYTSAREGDLIAFTEAQVQEMRYLTDPVVRGMLADKAGKVWGWQFTPQKSARNEIPTPLHIPFEPNELADVRRAIARNRAVDRAAGRLQTYVLVNDRSGLPWQKRHFIRIWQEVLDHAITRTGRSSLDGLQWRDLRRTRVVRLKRQGFTHDRIANLTGHSKKSIDKMMEVYGPIDSNMTAALIAESGERQRARGNGR